MTPRKWGEFKATNDKTVRLQRQEGGRTVRRKPALLHCEAGGGGMMTLGGKGGGGGE
ncbi:MAG: hypothetical protein ACK559_31400 [bacterium]